MNLVLLFKSMDNNNRTLPLRDHLANHLEREDDPKFERVREALNLEFEGRKWIEHGVLIFSQFYDSAYALAEYLLKHFEEPIGLRLADS